MRQGSYLIIILILQVVAGPVSAADRFPGDVRLVVNAGDLTDSITREFRRDLRNISGVYLTEGESDWLVHVVALKLTTRSGGESGVAVSYAVMKPHIGDPPGLVTWMRQGIHAGSLSDLPTICGSIVKEIDDEFLEPGRPDKQ